MTAMSDHIAAVRAQAEKESERRLDAFRKHVGFAPEDAAWWQMGFIEGQADLASRLTREKIAIALAKRKARDWDSMSGALHVAAIHAECPNADTILALLTDTP